jgi:FkbM family methyltransferase
MTIISYAQNFEDVMLLRAFRHIEKGFYIDVGANDPSTDSVTKAFYERGWSGINIEPLSSHFVDLQRERPHDINLHCAAGASKSEIDIWECDVRGWGTADKETIEKHLAMGKVGSYHRVPMTTLTEICKQHAPHDIHFLKIDVEGYERPVLEGMDFKRFRPWIVIVEATRPNSTEEIHCLWEDLLVKENYIFGYADGLNRFYIAREHEELAASLKYPPNIFDGFVHAGQIAEAEAKAQQANIEAHQADINAHQADIKAQQADINALHASIKVQQKIISEFEARTAAAESRSQELQTELNATLAANHLHWMLSEERSKEIQFLRQAFEIQAQENLEQIFLLTDAHEQNIQAITQCHEQKIQTITQYNEQKIQTIQQSISWRITAPFRYAMMTRLNIFHNAARICINIIVQLLAHAKLYINRRPNLRRISLAVIALFPSLKKGLRKAAIMAPLPKIQTAHITYAELPARTQHIYARLKKDIDNISKENC